MDANAKQRMMDGINAVTQGTRDILAVVKENVHKIKENLSKEDAAKLQAVLKNKDVKKQAQKTTEEIINFNKNYAP